MYHKLKISDLNEPVIVSIPIGMSVVCKNVYRDISVKITKDEMRWIFIPLSIGEFDSILRMDSVSHY